MARILQVHNRYQTSRSGEDTVVDEEQKLLIAHGHEVRQLIVQTSEADTGGKAELLRTAANNVYSLSGRRLVRHAIEEFRPDVAHVHNTFPLLSPSVFWELRSHPIRRVATLHNYRMTCAAGTLLRQGEICERCLGRSPLPGVKARCYKGSLPGSAAQALNQVVHRGLGTYARCLDAMVVLTEFCRDVFVRAGMPPDKLYVKPNFVNTIDPFPPHHERKNQIVYVGRMTVPKGLARLLEAWSKLDPSDHELVLIGDGPLREELQARFGNLRAVRWMGWQAREDAREVVRNAKWLIMPSVWYETFGLVLAEAFAVGTPVIAPDLGAMAEVAGHGKAGLLFDHYDPASLPRVLAEAMAMAPEGRRGLAQAGWESLHTTYSPETNYRLLMRIYGLEGA